MATFALMCSIITSLQYTEKLFPPESRLSLSFSSRDNLKHMGFSVMYMCVYSISNKAVDCLYSTCIQNVFIFVNTISW